MSLLEELIVEIAWYEDGLRISMRERLKETLTEADKAKKYYLKLIR